MKSLTCKVSHGIWLEWIMNYKTYLTITLLLLTVSEGRAQETTDAPPDIPETVVIGRPNSFPRNPLQDSSLLTPGAQAASSKTTGASVEVITSEDLKKQGTTTLLDALRNRTGISTSQNGGAGSLTSLFLRGSNSAHTKVLIDGIPMNDPSGASRAFNFANLTTDNIERIEILRGPQSVIYGSDAIGGVINIITKRGQGTGELNFSAYGGSLGTHYEGLQYSGGDEKSYYSIAGSYLETQSVSQAAARFGNTEADGFDVGTVSGRFGWNLQDDINLDYVFRLTNAEVEIDNWDFGAPNPVDNLNRANLSRNFANRVQLSKLAMDGRLEHKAAFSLSNYERQDTNVPSPFWASVYNGETRLFDYQANYAWNDNNLITAGVMYQDEEASTDLQSQQNQTTTGVFLEDRMTLKENWHATAGIRWDEFSRAGQADTYRFSTIYHLKDKPAHIHASLGTGFRAPALAENLFAFGNPNLAPEMSKGWELGYTTQLKEGSLLLDATYFRNDFKNLIVWNPSSSTLDNVGLALSSGVEVTLAWQLTDRTSMNANYTYTKTLNRQTGEELLRRPRHRAMINLEHDLENDLTSVGLTLAYTGSRLDNPGGTTTELGHFMLLNLYLTHKLNDRWTAYFRANNLTDEDYEELFGYGTPGATFYGGLSLTR